MVIAGNGIAFIGITLLSDRIMTGVSSHFIQITRIYSLHKYTDEANANIHQTLKMPPKKNALIILPKMEMKFDPNLSIQWRFRSVKYRTPCTVVLEQKSSTTPRAICELT